MPCTSRHYRIEPLRGSKRRAIPTPMVQSGLQHATSQLNMRERSNARLPPLGAPSEREDRIVRFSTTGDDRCLVGVCWGGKRGGKVAGKLQERALVLGFTRSVAPPR